MSSVPIGGFSAARRSAISCFASAGWATTSTAPTYAAPEVGITRVVSIPAVVVLPAPFGPSSPKISPECTLRVERIHRGDVHPRIDLRQTAPCGSPRGDPRHPPPRPPDPIVGASADWVVAMTSRMYSGPRTLPRRNDGHDREDRQEPRALAQAVAAHDRENLDAHRQRDRSGALRPRAARIGGGRGDPAGITIHADSGVTGNFRVLCDGEQRRGQDRGRGRGRRGGRHPGGPAGAPASRPGNPFAGRSAAVVSRGNQGAAEHRDGNFRPGGDHRDSRSIVGHCRSWRAAARSTDPGSHPTPAHVQRRYRAASSCRACRCAFSSW